MNLILERALILNWKHCAEQTAYGSRWHLKNSGRTVRDPPLYFLSDSAVNSSVMKVFSAHFELLTWARGQTCVCIKSPGWSHYEVTRRAAFVWRKCCWKRRRVRLQRTITCSLTAQSVKLGEIHGVRLTLSFDNASCERFCTSLWTVLWFIP